MDRDDLEALRVSLALACELVHAEPTSEALASYAEYDLFLEAPFAPEDLDVREGLGGMRRWLDGLPAPDDEQGRSAGVKELASDWLQLIAGAGEPKAPSWAGYYMATNSQILSPQTLPVRNLYARWGLELARKNREPDDDLGIMLGFLGHLVDVELAGGAQAGAAVEDQRELLADHVLPWICTWRYNMQKYARTEFYRGVGLYVFGLVRAYALRFGITYNASGTPSYWVKRD